MKFCFEKTQKNCQKNAKLLIEILKLLSKIMVSFVKKETPMNEFSRFYVIFDKEDKNPILPVQLASGAPKIRLQKEIFEKMTSMIQLLPKFTLFMFLNLVQLIHFSKYPQFPYTTSFCCYFDVFLQSDCLLIKTLYKI